MHKYGLPRFGSAACFAVLLDDEQAGGWQIVPAAGGPATRRGYREDTVVAKSEWDTPDGGRYGWWTAFHRVAVLIFERPKRAVDVYFGRTAPIGFAVVEHLDDGVGEAEYRRVLTVGGGCLPDRKSGHEKRRRQPAKCSVSSIFMEFL